MDHSHKKPAAKRKTFWTHRVSLLVIASLAVTFCVVIRYLGGVEHAVAKPKAKSSRNRQVTVDTKKHGIVAVINQKPIQRSELARECMNRFGEDVLETVANKYILLMECKRREVVITKEEVEREVTSMANKFGITVEHWLGMLEDERKINPRQYRNDVIWPTLALRKLAAKSITVSDDEIKQAWDSQYGPKVKVRLIALTQKTKADQIYRQALATPTDFAELAMDHSQDVNSAPYGGLVPPIRRHMGSPELEQVAFSLKPGQISRVIHVANQYVILKCEKILAPTTVSEKDFKVVRSRLESNIHSAKQREMAAETFSTLQNKAQFTNVYNNPNLRQKNPGVAATINGKQITIRQLAEECLLRHGISVLDIEINRRLLQQELKRRNLSVQQADLHREVERAARAFGITKNDGSPQINSWLKMVTEEQGVTKEIYMSDIVWPTVALKTLIGSRVQVTEDDLHKGFEANYGERVECLAIVMSDQRRAQKVWAESQKSPNAKAFARLASIHSIEPISRNNDGEVPPIAKFSGQPEVEEAAFELKPEEMSGIIVSGDRYIILRAKGRTQPIVKDFAAVRDTLYEDILEKKLRASMGKEFDHIKESAQIDNFLAGTTQSGRGNKIPTADRRAERPGTPPGSVIPATATQPGSTPRRNR
ncbi:MAG: peptidylprolyl isomerase [Planctomycetaceae bacterium]|nr:peptidylprolyl isomerase [Planctomycetaceae bacterium]MBP63864.1 peptidylprolyl isomerase [Planctomycetaceae bacterium]